MKNKSLYIDAGSENDMADTALFDTSRSNDVIATAEQWKGIGRIPYTCEHFATRMRSHGYPVRD